MNLKTCAKGTKLRVYSLELVHTDVCEPFNVQAHGGMGRVWKFGKYCQYFGKKLIIDGGWNEIGHRLSTEQKISDIREISMIYW